MAKSAWPTAVIITLMGLTLLFIFFLGTRHRLSALRSDTALANRDTKLVAERPQLWEIELPLCRDHVPDKWRYWQVCSRSEVALRDEAEVNGMQPLALDDVCPFERPRPRLATPFVGSPPPTTGLRLVMPIRMPMHPKLLLFCDDLPPELALGLAKVDSAGYG